MKYKLLSTFCAFLVAASNVSAQVGDGFTEKEEERVKEILKTQVDGMVKLPITGIQLIEAGGNTYGVSDNGRFVFTGKIIDMWNGVQIKNTADANKYATKINVQKLGINFDELNPVVIGNGRSEFIVFVDPNCPHCHKILVAASKMKKHMFKFIMLPLLGSDSVEKMKKGACHNDRAAVSRALIDNKWEKITVGAADCGSVANQKAIVLARIFGVTSVPFTISVVDGAVQQGVPPDFAAWADEHSLENGTRGQKSFQPVLPNSKNATPERKK